jgi:hypothetical protein
MNRFEVITGASTRKVMIHGSEAVILRSVNTTWINRGSHAPITMQGIPEIS